MKKTLITILCTVLVCSCVMGATLALIMDKTETITNTFTIGSIDIDLTENTGTSYKMVPGATIAKDPKVTVKNGSEACWLFIKVEKSTNFADFMTYAMAEGWTQLKDANGVDIDGVYYRKVEATTADAPFAVLDGNKVTVKSEVTNAMAAALTTDTYPTLKFTAYAVQLTDGTTEFTPAAAWTQAQAAAIYNAPTAG